MAAHALVGEGPGARRGVGVGHRALDRGAHQRRERVADRSVLDVLPGDPDVGAHRLRAGGHHELVHRVLRRARVADVERGADLAFGSIRRAELDAEVASGGRRPGLEGEAGDLRDREHRAGGGLGMRDHVGLGIDHAQGVGLRRQLRVAVVLDHRGERHRRIGAGSEDRRIRGNGAREVRLRRHGGARRTFEQHRALRRRGGNRIRGDQANEEVVAPGGEAPGVPGEAQLARLLGLELQQAERHAAEVERAGGADHRARRAVGAVGVEDLHHHHGGSRRGADVGDRSGHRDAGVRPGAQGIDRWLADGERSAAGEESEVVRHVGGPRDLQGDELRRVAGRGSAQVEAQPCQVAQRKHTVRAGGRGTAADHLDRRVRERRALGVGDAPGDRGGGALRRKRHGAGVHGRSGREHEALARAVVAGERVDRDVAQRRERQVEGAVARAVAGRRAVQHHGDARKRGAASGDYHAADKPAGRRRGLGVGIERRREIERRAAGERAATARELVAEEARAHRDGAGRHGWKFEAAQQIAGGAERRRTGDRDLHARQRQAASRGGHAAAHDAGGGNLAERDPAGVECLAGKQRVRSRRPVVARARDLRRIVAGGEAVRGELAFAVGRRGSRARAAHRNAGAGERQVGGLVDDLAGERRGGGRGSAGAERAQRDGGQERIVLPAAGCALPADKECAGRRTQRGIAHRRRDRDQRDRGQVDVSLEAAVRRLALQHPREQAAHRGGGAAVTHGLQREKRERAVFDARKVVRRGDAAVGLHVRHEVCARIARDRAGPLAGARERKHGPRRVERIAFETRAAAEAAVSVAA